MSWKSWAIAGLFLTTPCFGEERLTVGSKIFTESSILAEIAAQMAESQNGHVNRKLGMGSTGILLESLRTGAIDVYPDYSGTLAETVLKDSGLRSIAAIRERLETQGLTISNSLGFDNTYALAVTRKFAEEHKLKRISDLNSLGRPLRAAFSYEFMNRSDGFNGMLSAYALQFDPERTQRMEHSLVYKAIADDSVDVIEVYSTDANIKKFDLVTLDDDRAYFPSYQAVWVANLEFVKSHPKLWSYLRSAEGRLKLEPMREMNAEVDIHKMSYADVAAKFLKRGPSVHAEAYRQIFDRTLEHLWLVCISVLFSIVIGVPVGIVAGLYRRLGKGLIALSSLIQTIPSLALLSFLIPVFGIGTTPAVIALCLYSLLPVVLNTATGIIFVDEKHLENARAFGMSSREILVHVTLPLASPTILAGFKTATILSIGTATLAAFVGAGGYGALIISGLSLNDTPTILMGAVPAAVLAVIASFLLDLAQRKLVPEGIREK